MWPGAWRPTAQVDFPRSGLSGGRGWSRQAPHLWLPGPGAERGSPPTLLQPGTGREKHKHSAQRLGSGKFSNPSSQAKSPFLLVHFFCIPTGKDFSFGTLPMQMCEDSRSHVPRTEHFLLTGKHTAPGVCTSGAGPRPGAAGSQPRGLSAPWEPQPALRRWVDSWGWEPGLRRLRATLPGRGYGQDSERSKAMPSPAQVALDKSLHLPSLWLKLGKSSCTPQGSFKSAV